MADIDLGLRLAELLATKLCHDISGPLNTMLGAADVAEDDPSATAEAFGLMVDASKGMAARLQICRAAWGGGGAMSGPAFAKLASNLEGRRFRLDLQRLETGVDFSADAARILLNILLVAGESLPRGGVAALQGNPSHDVILQIDGPQAAWPADFMALLADPAEAWAMLDDPARLQTQLTVLLAAQAGIRISVLMGNTATPAPPLLIALGT